MTGKLSREELARRAESGEIDTIITVFPDLYGRLVGKRITTRFFLEKVVEQILGPSPTLLDTFVAIIALSLLPLRDRPIYSSDSPRL